MQPFSIGSVVFVALSLCLPPLMRGGGLHRRYLFLAVNLAVVCLSFKSLYASVVTALWLLIPYFFAPFLHIKNADRRINAAFYFLMVAVFCYLMHYEWILPFRFLPYLPSLRVMGLSYFLFREIDFTMQYAYLQEEHIKISLVDYLNYVTDFYCVAAGPIMRYDEFVEDFYSPKPELTDNELLSCLHRFLGGYIKVFVISSVLSLESSVWFKKISQTDTALKAVLIFCVFAFLNGWYIYFNFSGYCDVVISAAKLSGMQIHENFDRPYLARSVVEFWNRHHITLSEWIRDYIYSPLFNTFISGIFKKRLFAGQCAALFITFLAAGIWHGGSINYVFYGFFQGLGVVVSTVRTSYMKKKLGKAGFREFESRKAVRIVENCLTWGYICLTFSFVGYDVCSLFYSK